MPLNSHSLLHRYEVNYFNVEVSFNIESIYCSLLLRAPEPVNVIENSQLVFEKDNISSAWAYKRTGKFSKWSQMGKCSSVQYSQDVTN